MQTRLVFEAGQLKGAILMSFPDRIHALQKRTYGHQSGLPDKPITDEGWAQVGLLMAACMTRAFFTFIKYRCLM